MLVRLLRGALGQALSSFRPGGSRGLCQPRRRRATCRPRVERLESRLTPSGDFGFALAVTASGYSYAESKAVATDRAGNVFIAGTFSGTVDFDPRPGVSNLTCKYTDRDVFVAKYTAAGALAWARQLGGGGATGNSDFGSGIAVDAAGDVYVTGSFTGTANFDPGPGSFNLTSGAKGTAFVEKLDGAGNFVWARAFPSDGFSAGFAVAVDFAGNVYTTGNFDGTTNFGPGPGTFDLTGGGAFVTKLDTGGNLLWAKKFGGTTSGVGLAVDGRGGVYTTGFFSDAADFAPGFRLTSGNRGVEAYVAKLDALGNFVWAKGFPTTDGSGFTQGQAVAVDGAGAVYFTVGFSGTADFDPGPGTFNLTSVGNDALVKLDGAGNFVWAKQFAPDPSGNAGISSLAIDGAGNVYTTGIFGGTVDFDPGPGTFDLTGPFATIQVHDSYVAKLDGAGNFVWARQFHGSGSNSGVGTLTRGGGLGIAVDGRGDVYTSGVFNGTVDFDPGPGTFNLTSGIGFFGLPGATFVSKLLDTPAGTLLPAPPTVQNVYVNPAWAGLAPGTDPDGSGPATAIGVDAFAAIQPALNAAASGSTVHLAPGTYSGALILSKRVRLVGSGSASTVLAGQGSGTGLDIIAPGVEISGLTVRGFGTALFASGPAYLALTDVPLTGNIFGGEVRGVRVALIAGGPGDDIFFVTPSVLARQGDNALGYSGVEFLTVDGGGGNNRLTVFLYDTIARDTVWLTGSAIARDTAPFLLFYRATGGTFGGGVTVVLGEPGGVRAITADTVVVQGQLPGAPTTVYANGGDDGFWVLVSETSNYAGLTLDGGAGASGVAVLDQSGGAVLRDLGPVIGEGVLQVSYPDGAVSRIAYQNLNEFLGGLPVTQS
jgi:hypothetical protein